MAKNATFFTCACGQRTSSTNAARAAARVCVHCRPDLDVAPPPAKTTEMKAAWSPCVTREAATRKEESPIIDTVEPVAGGVATAVVEPMGGAVPVDPSQEVAYKIAVVADPAAPAPVVPSKRKKASALDAAALVLREAGVGMNAKEIFAVITERQLWTSPNGRTPCATLAAALLRETVNKGIASRFVKSERGKFASNPVVTES
jgi:hypothetical protein